MIVRLVMLVFGVLLMCISPASGQIKSPDVVGTWVGVLELTGDKSPVEVEFKSDGGFGGSVKTAKEGLVLYKGGWKIEGANVVVNYRYAATGPQMCRPWGEWWTDDAQGKSLSGFVLEVRQSSIRRQIEQEVAEGGGGVTASTTRSAAVWEGATRRQSSADRDNAERVIHRSGWGWRRPNRCGRCVYVPERSGGQARARGDRVV
jgi:hypothetical protein